jgi:hypothetical protein
MSNFNLIIGKIGALQTSPLTPAEAAAFGSYYADLVASKREVDPEIARSWELQQSFYAFAATVAKAYFSTNQIPFVPQEPTSGSFGVREILPIDLTPPANFAASPLLAGTHTWVQSLTVGVNSAWVNLFGSSATPITPSNIQSYHSLLAFHSLISWQPGTRIVGIKHNVNSYGYPVVSLEEAAKIEKPYKTFKIIPLEGDFLIHPTGTFYTQIQLEKLNIANSETYTENIGIMGMVFAEYSYLNALIN